MSEHRMGSGRGEEMSSPKQCCDLLLMKTTQAGERRGGGGGRRRWRGKERRGRGAGVDS